MEDKKYICPKCGDEMRYFDSIKYYNAMEDSVDYDDIYKCPTCNYKEVK